MRRPRVPSRRPRVASIRLSLYPPFGLSVGHGVAKRADTGDFDLDDVTGHHRSHPGRTAGQQHIAGFESDPSGDERRQLPDVEHHFRGRSVLHHLAAEPGGDPQRRRTGYVGLDPWTQWAERVCALGPGPLAVVTPVVRGDVVRTGVAHHEVRGAISRHIPRRATDDDGQLALILQALHFTWPQYHGVRRGNRVGGLQEQRWLLRPGPALLGDLIG